MDVRSLRHALLDKLNAVESRAGHHVFFYFEYMGKMYLGPKMSHSWRGDLHGQQIAWLRRPLLLSSRELEDFVSCPLSGSEFFTIWAERKGLP